MPRVFFTRFIPNPSDQFGSPLRSAAVTVLDADTGVATVDTLTSDQAGSNTLTQPLTTDGGGNLSFWAPSPRLYTLQFQGSNLPGQVSVPTTTSPSVFAPGTEAQAFAATPAVPASTTPLTNNTGVPVTVYLSGGAVTVVAIGGQATGMTSGSFRLPPGMSIAITYSAAPTWLWQSE